MAVVGGIEVVDDGLPRAVIVGVAIVGNVDEVEDMGGDGGKGVPVGPPAAGCLVGGV